MTGTLTINETKESKIALASFEKNQDVRYFHLVISVTRVINQSDTQLRTGESMYQEHTPQ